MVIRDIWDVCINHIVTFLGHFRRTSVIDKQKSIDIKALFEMILADESLVKIFKKKTLSTEAYVCNMFYKNIIDKQILENKKQVGLMN